MPIVSLLVATMPCDLIPLTSCLVVKGLFIFTCFHLRFSFSVARPISHLASRDQSRPSSNGDLSRSTGATPEPGGFHFPYRFFALGRGLHSSGDTGCSMSLIGCC